MLRRVLWIGWKLTLGTVSKFFPFRLFHVLLRVPCVGAARGGSCANSLVDINGYSSVKTYILGCFIIF
jgi:hypothetical protein